MGKKNYIYFSLFAVITLIYLGVEIFGPKPIDWSESYTRSDKIPHGGYILYNELDQIFPNQRISVNDSPPIYLLQQMVREDRTSRNWIFINNEYSLDRHEAELMLKAVESGDHLFMAASNLQGFLADTLQIRTGFLMQNLSSGIDQRERDVVLNNFTNPELRDNEGWSVERVGNRYFTSFDSTRTTVLGVMDSERANFIKIDHGSGFIYLHLHPRLFTNYYLRDLHYADYAFKALSYLPVQEVVWDGYYKAGRPTYGGPMGFILSKESLRSAWYTGLVAIILFMFFKGKRKQRPIPVLSKPKNSTLGFAKTVGNLYYEEGSHKEIAGKKILFFMDYLRRNLGIAQSDMEKELPRVVSERSGLPLDEVQDLLQLIQTVKQKPSISQKELTKLNRQIDQFYKTSQR